MPSFNENTVHLDLDAVMPPKRVTLKLKGVVHEVQEATVQTYIENTIDLQSLKLSSDIVAEIDLSIRMIRRSVPTLDETQIRDLSLSQVQAILNFTRVANGESAVETRMAEEATVVENPPEAGK